MDTYLNITAILLQRLYSQIQNDREFFPAFPRGMQEKSERHDVGFFD